MKASSILAKIQNLGLTPAVSVTELDGFVDDCIQFLRNQQSEDPDLNFVDDIFELEAARQDALRDKLRNSD